MPWTSPSACCRAVRSVVRGCILQRNVQATFGIIFDLAKFFCPSTNVLHQLPQRVVVTSRDLWFASIRRRHIRKRRAAVLTQILQHLGVPVILRRIPCIHVPRAAVCSCLKSRQVSILRRPYARIPVPRIFGRVCLLQQLDVSTVHRPCARSSSHGQRFARANNITSSFSSHSRSTLFTAAQGVAKDAQGSISRQSLERGHGAIGSAGEKCGEELCEEKSLLFSFLGRNEKVFWEPTKTKATTPRVRAHVEARGKQRKTGSDGYEAVLARKAERQVQGV